MFRTSNLRGQTRFDHFRLGNLDKTGKLSLTNDQVQLIETTTAFTLGEKIELLLVALGNKLTAEIFQTVTYAWNETSQTEVPNPRDLSAIENVLKQLPFVHFQDHLVKINRQSDRPQDLTWYQVSVNESVSTFMKEFADDMTEFEEGVLYGFPISAIRAFSRLTEAHHEKPNAATYYLAGWCSADFWEDEQAYYHLWWERLRKLSPTLIAEAEAQHLVT
jgi:hypothetical protein